MPYALLQAYARALPKLRAEEMLRDAMVTAYGGGNMKAEDADAFAKSLREQAGIKRTRKRASNAELRELFGGPSAMPLPGKVKA